MMADPREQDCIFEVEYTSTGEAGLLDRKQKCAKNPRHEGFTPLKTFTQKDLPIAFQTEEMTNLIKIIAHLTVKIRVFYTSMDRPMTSPETGDPYSGANFRGCSIMRVGTGFIADVMIINEQQIPDDSNHCPCFDCQRSKHPELIWGKVSIVTAAHVLCKLDELVFTEVDCFYDNDDKNGVSTLYGQSMKASPKSPITRMDYTEDVCQLYFITHNIDLCRKLNEYQIYDLLTSDLKISSSSESALAIIVSHPHGCSKCVSVGEWVSRDTLNNPGDPDKHRYYYNTPTCPGSSGALVWLLETSHGKGHKIYVHSAGPSDGDGLNISGSVDMFSELIKSKVQCHIS